MTEPSKPSSLSAQALKVQDMFDRIAPRYDLLNRILSARQDVKWRRKLCAQLPRSPGQDLAVLDVACGTGDVMLEILRKRPDYQKVWGIDLSANMLNHAEQREAMRDWMRTSTRDVKLIQGTATDLPFPDESFQAVTIAFGLRNVDDRKRALKEFSRVLKPSGSLFVLEFFPIQSKGLSGFFDFYFRSVLPLIGGMLSDREAYRYLPDSVKTMPELPEFCGNLEQAGLVFHSCQNWLFGGCRLIEAVRMG